jgi:hypothetical protein
MHYYIYKKFAKKFFKQKNEAPFLPQAKRIYNENHL